MTTPRTHPEPVASYHDRDEWLDRRKTGIGGSDAAAILGVNPYKTPLDVYRDKVGDVPPSAITKPMRAGILLEPIAADMYAEETGRGIRRQPLKRHPEYGFMIGNVDRQIFAGTGEGDYAVETTGILEIKTAGMATFSRCKAHGLDDSMVVQLMHYLAVYGYEWGSFALLGRERWELIHFDLERDDEFIDQLIDRERAFWLDHVEAHVPPHVDEEDEILVPEVEGELAIMEDPKWQEVAQDYREARHLKDTAKDLESTAKERVQAMMKRAEEQAIEVPGIARFYYKQMGGRTSWKKTAEKMAKANNLQLESYIVKGKSYERFSPFFMGGE